MDHRKLYSHAHVSTESKLSPDVKKAKLSDSPNTRTRVHNPVQHTSQSDHERTGMTEFEGQAETRSSVNMAAPTGPAAKRPLFSDPSVDSPPQWFKAFEDRLDSKIECLSEKVTTIRLKNKKKKIQNLDFEVEKIRKEVDEVKKENEWLTSKLDDLENRGRRKNLVIFGIPESEGGKEDCHKVVSEFLTFAGVESADIKSIERCHRTPGSPYKPRSNGKPQAKPRMIHIGFASFVVKERVRKACIGKIKVCKTYMDSKIFIAEDLSKRVLELRKKKMPQVHRLREEGRRPFFIYPDRLCYRDNTTGKLVQVDPSS